MQPKYWQPLDSTEKRVLRGTQRLQLPQAEACCCRLGKEQDRIAMAAQLCTCVFEGNLPLLRRLIRAGAAADAGDYDKRTALHIAASEGNTAAVSEDWSQYHWLLNMPLR